MQLCENIRLFLEFFNNFVKKIFAKLLYSNALLGKLIFSPMTHR